MTNIKLIEECRGRISITDKKVKELLESINKMNSQYRELYNVIEEDPE